MSAGGGGAPSISVPTPVALVNRTTSLSVTDGTAITWNNEVYDNESVIAVSATTMTIPSTGLYRVTSTAFTSSSATGAQSMINGSASHGRYANLSENSVPRWTSGQSAIVALSASDTVALHAIGGTTNFGAGGSNYTAFGLERVDPDIWYALVRKSASQTSHSSGNITFDTEVADVGGWHDTTTNNDRLTVPAGSGITRVKLSANYELSGSTTTRAAEITKNGAVDVVGLPTRHRAAVRHVNLCSPPILVSEGDYFALSITNDAAIDIVAATDTWFQIEQVPASIKSGLVYNSGSFPTITTSDAVVTWNSEDHDPDGMHSTVSNTSRLTVPSGCTYARLYFQLKWPTATADRIQCQLRMNAAAVIGPAIDNDLTTAALGTRCATGASAWIQVTPGDYFEMLCSASSNATLNGGWFAMECI